MAEAIGISAVVIVWIEAVFGGFALLIVWYAISAL